MEVSLYVDNFNGFWIVKNSGMNKAFMHKIKYWLVWWWCDLSLHWKIFLFCPLLGWRRIQLGRCKNFRRCGIGTSSNQQDLFYKRNPGVHCFYPIDYWTMLTREDYNWTWVKLNGEPHRHWKIWSLCRYEGFLLQEGREESQYKRLRNRI